MKRGMQHNSVLKALFFLGLGSAFAPHSAQAALNAWCALNPDAPDCTPSGDSFLITRDPDGGGISVEFRQEGGSTASFEGHFRFVSNEDGSIQIQKYDERGALVSKWTPVYKVPAASGLPAIGQLDVKMDSTTTGVSQITTRHDTSGRETVRQITEFTRSGIPVRSDIWLTEFLRDGSVREHRKDWNYGDANFTYKRMETYTADEYRRLTARLSYVAPKLQLTSAVGNTLADPDHEMDVPYQLTVKNPSSFDAPESQIILEFANAEPVAFSPPGGWTCDWTSIPHLGICTVENLAPGDSQDLSLMLRVPASDNVNVPVVNVSATTYNDWGASKADDADKAQAVVQTYQAKCTSPGASLPVYSGIAAHLGVFCAGEPAFDSHGKLNPVKPFVALKPESGEVTVAPNGELVYKPSGLYLGADSFSVAAVPLSGVQGTTASMSVQIRPAAPECKGIHELPTTSFTFAPDEGDNTMTLTLNCALPAGANSFGVKYSMEKPKYGEFQEVDSVRGIFKFKPKAGFVGDDIVKVNASNGGMAGKALPLTIHVTSAISPKPEI